MSEQHENQGRGTQAVHAGWNPREDHDGAVNVPIQLSTTYAQAAPGEPGRFEYARSANETRGVLERAMAELEGGAGGYAFASGLAAIDAVVRATTRSGQTILVGTDVYGGTYRLLAKGYAGFGVRCQAVDLCDTRAVAAWLGHADVSLVWVETPSNPRLGIVDIAALSKLTHEAGALLVVDNTFATPYLQHPLELGADVVVHSATKYLAGHSDVVGGIAVARDASLGEAIGWIQNAAGAIMAPFDAYLTLRGIRTLAVRLDRACDNAMAIVEMLQRRGDISEIWYPGIGVDADVADSQMTRPGAMVSFAPTGGADRARKVAEELEVFVLAESLGAVESLVCVPAAMTHASVTGTELEVPADLLRLSVGIEDVADLIADLERALDAKA